MTESYDQTQFVAEEPLYERPAKVPAPKTTVAQVDQPKPRSRKHWFIFAAIGLFFLLLLLIVVATVMRRESGPETQNEETEEAEQEQVMDPFRQRIRDLEIELKAADPTKDDLPFPPVDMDIRLE